MQYFWEQWSQLDAQPQLIMIALAATGAFGLLKRCGILRLLKQLRPNLVVTQDMVKQYIVAGLAFVGTYATTDGNILSAVIALLVAIGAYRVYKEQLVDGLYRQLKGE